MKQEQDFKNLSEKERIKARNKAEMTPKQKVAHFFNYYTGVLVAIAAVLIISGITLYQCSVRVEDDCGLLLVGESHFLSTDELAAAEAELSKLVEDTNGDGQQKVSIVDIPLGSGAESEYTMALQQKLTVEYTVGTSDLMLLSKQQFETSAAKDGLDILVPISDYVPDAAFDGYGVEFQNTILADNPAFAMIPKDYILCLKFENPDQQEKEEYQQKRAATIELLKVLTGN